MLTIFFNQKLKERIYNSGTDTWTIKRKKKTIKRFSSLIRFVDL